ncbi:2-oxoglutarate-dependent dioxygenase htyE-like isoform X2 [Thrips palmi]|nr:2-oxoglutarate-dependent dioxygenase htyE-like isoform X2 [Thrips palmi]
MDRFCALPQDTRDVYRRIPPHQHGYVAPGTERLSEEWIGEIRHTFNVSVCDCYCQHSVLAGKLPPHDEVPGFQEAVDDLGQDFKRLARLLLQAVAVGLELPVDFFLQHHKGMTEEGAVRAEGSPTTPTIQIDPAPPSSRPSSRPSSTPSSRRSSEVDANGHALHEGNESSLRLEFYPPFGAPPPAGVTRCGEHTDCGTLSILAQDSEGGLEVQTADKQWARVGHLPGALLINTGDVMSAWTCNRYAPTLQRVIVPEQPKVRARGRHAVGFLVQPDNDTLICPIERLALAAQAANGSAGLAGHCLQGPMRAELFVDSSRRRKRSFYAPHHNIASRLRETAAS